MENNKIKLLAITSFLACTSLAWSQSATAPSTRTAPRPTALQKYESQKKGLKLPDVTALLQWGPVTIRPHVDYRFSTANGLNSDNEVSNDTDIHTYSAGLDFLLGEHWTLGYKSSWRRHSSDSFEDTRDDGFFLTGWAQTPNWIINFRQSYSKDSSTQIESATQSKDESFNTSLQGSRQLGLKTGLSLGLNYSLRDAEDFDGGNDYNDTQSVSTMNWFQYQNSQRLNTGIGIGAGYTSVDNGVDSSFQTAQAQANLQLTQKVAFSTSVGAETRQIKVEGSDTLTNPIYNASINYKPFEQTTLSVAAVRTVNYSIYRDDVAERTSWTFNLGQRFLGRYSFSFSATERESDFIDTSGSLDLVDSDTYTSFSYRLSTQILTKGTISIFYHSSENKSSNDNFEQSSNQAGVDLSYDF